MGQYDSNPVIEGRYDAYGRRTYWAKGFTGKGYKIGVVDNFNHEHGHMMASVCGYIAPDAEVLRFDMGSADTYSLEKQLNIAAESDVDVLSISHSVESDTTTLHRAIKRCYDAGIAIFCSAGNSGEKFADTVDIKRYPAAYDETISILSIDNTFVPSAFSSHGSTGVVTGFGTNVLVKNKAGQEVLATGTSPVVPTMAALSVLLMQELFERTGVDIKPEQLQKEIISRCIDLGAIGKDNMTGFGFFTLDKSEYERVKLMMLDANNNGLADRVDRIKTLILNGVPYHDAERSVSSDYFVIGYEMLSGIAVPIYGGRKPNV